MPPKKKARKKRAPGRARKTKASKSSYLLKAVTALLILVFIVTATGLILHLTLPGKKAIPPQPPVTLVKKIPLPPVFEIYPKEEKEPVPTPPNYPPSSPKTVAPASPPPKETEREEPDEERLPRVSIIIDDIGYDYQVAEGFIILNSNITLSILPFSPHGVDIARLAYKGGMEVMLHMPMEPLNYPKTDPGPGTLFEKMTPDQFISRIIVNLDAIPHVVGVNNHMGSKITASEPKVHQLFTILKKRNLFFIDSRTTGNTVCQHGARLFRLPFAQRDVFLDNQLDRAAIQKQLSTLVKIAEERGAAVGIGHAHSITLEVLENQISSMKKRVDLVPASDIVHIVETRT